MKVLIALSVLLAIASANPPPPVYHSAPVYKPAPAPIYPDTAPVYNYQYAAKDDYEAVDVSADEARDGYSTSGSYSVLLPDGRTQIVTYTVADAESGFVADVTYAGEAKYTPPPPPPAYKPAPPPPPPAYRPAPPPPPAYRPAPPPVYRA